MLIEKVIPAPILDKTVGIIDPAVLSHEMILQAVLIIQPMLILADIAVGGFSFSADRNSRPS
jgi:hypothetical protein